MEILWAIPYFAAAVLIHALVVRVPIRGDSVRKFVAVGGLIAVLLGLHALVGFVSLRAGIAALVAYAFACELYLFLFTLAGSSVSVRLLRLLNDGPRRRTEMEAVLAPPKMVEERIARMKAVGLIEANGAVSPRGRRLVARFLAWKRFFRHPLPAEITATAEPARQFSGIA